MKSKVSVQTASASARRREKSFFIQNRPFKRILMDCKGSVPVSSIQKERLLPPRFHPGMYDCVHLRYFEKM